MSARFNVFLSESAKADLRTIHEAISNHGGLRDAALFLELLLDKVNTLQQFPRRGRIPHELEDSGDDGCRQIALQHYRIVYQVSEPDVYVIMIADSRRDMRGLLQRRISRGS